MFVKTLSLSFFTIKLTPIDKNILSKEGYLGKDSYSNNVYFIQNRNVTYDYSYNKVEDISDELLYTFSNNTLLNMSAAC